MKKILVINTVRFKYNGITSVIVNYYKLMDKKKYQFSFVAINELNREFKELFKEYNSDVYVINRKNRIVKYFLQLVGIMRRGKYDIVHIHGNSATMTVELLAAYICKIPIRIAHCHTNKTEHVYIHRLLYPLFSKLYTVGVACSEQAGNWIFKNNYTLLVNGIDVEKYYYRTEVRENVRKMLKIRKEDIVIGHVGLFHESKNHSKLFGILQKLLLYDNNFYLVCITGTEYVPQQIQMEIESKGLKDRILILHNRTDVNEILQAMDLFIFPSKWEGFGISLLEAQASELRCFVSDKVTKEINITNCIKYIKLNDNDEKWAEYIYDDLCKNRIEREKHKNFNILKNSKYDLCYLSEALDKLYEGKK